VFIFLSISSNSSLETSSGERAERGVVIGLVLGVLGLVVVVVDSVGLVGVVGGNCCCDGGCSVVVVP